MHGVRNDNEDVKNVKMLLKIVTGKKQTNKYTIHVLKSICTKQLLIHRAKKIVTAEIQRGSYGSYLLGHNDVETAALFRYFAYFSNFC